MAIDRSAAMRRFLADQREPVTPRDAATVLLLRDAGTDGGGIEVFMLRRHRGMAFAPGMYVYPGGSVEPHDRLPVHRFGGPTRHEWARALDTSADLAHSLVCAAIRETFEECGVLLAAPDPESGCPLPTGTDWDQQRLALAQGRTTLGALLEEHGLVARTDLLRPLGRWITPIFSTRRFDTRFFIAPLPDGAACRDFGEESDAVEWVPVRETLDRYERGDIPMMLATADALNTLAPHDSVAAALAAPPPSNIPLIVRAIRDGADFRFVVDGPDDAVPVDDFLSIRRRAC
ncbi:MAG TPA: NUDIX hydrolase [Flexivirga sp.]|uniref:NUDIX hydrolase n=1 Tax=Flexivirga sp. TaxID=1962927 RepID=UPI002C026C82|nr:NUDIX hydrolase [Flexivirga sp.]HWC22419.1 NUDIX hydrolase [Flexivirga sp.]